MIELNLEDGERLLEALDLRLAARLALLVGLRLGDAAVLDLRVVLVHGVELGLRLLAVAGDLRDGLLLGLVLLGLVLHVLLLGGLDDLVLLGDLLSIYIILMYIYIYICIISPYIYIYIYVILYTYMYIVLLGDLLVLGRRVGLLLLDLGEAGGEVGLADLEDYIVYVYIYIYTYVSLSLSLSLSLYIYIYIYAYMCIHISLYIYIYTHTYRHTYIRHIIIVCN